MLKQSNIEWEKGRLRNRPLYWYVLRVFLK